MPQPAWVKGRLQPEPYLSRLFYGLVVKRSSTYMGFVMVTATFVGIGYDYFMEGIWAKVNKGVRAAAPAAAPTAAPDLRPPPPPLTRASPPSPRGAETLE